MYYMYVYKIFTYSHLEPVVEELLTVAVHPGVELLFELVAGEVDVVVVQLTRQRAMVGLPVSPLPVVFLRVPFRILSSLALFSGPGNTHNCGT